MSTTTEHVLESEDQILAFTHSTRKQVVNSLMSKGVPQDGESLNILLKTVDGMDRAALTRKRIKADEKVADQAAAASGLIAQVLLAVGSRRGQLEPVQTITHREPPMLGPDIPTPILVEGECEVNPIQVQYDAFMATFPPEFPDEEDQS